MAIHDLNAFLHDYFTSNQCQVNQKRSGVLHVQLTEEMDKILMNRPFYWHYIKQMGFSGEPFELTLITDPDKADEDGEVIHFGSPRLQQIMKHLKNNERFTKLFEQIDTNKKVTPDSSEASGPSFIPGVSGLQARVPLYPWLVVNMKISYQGKQKKDEIFSIGLHLLNGGMQLEMMDSLKERPLRMGIDDYCYTIAPVIKLQSGLKRIESVIADYIHRQDHEWADLSKQALHEELQLLEHFYEGREDMDSTHKQKEINELSMRYEPKITMEILNGGIFYLQN